MGRSSITIPIKLIISSFSKEGVFYLRFILGLAKSLTHNTEKVSHLKNLLLIKSVFDNDVYKYVCMNYGKQKHRVFDYFIIFFLLAIPFIYNTANWVPDKLQFYEFAGLKIEGYGFKNLSSFIWYVSIKLCVLIPCIFWFITCYHWWRYTILSPIVLTIFQMWGAFKNEMSILDETEIFQALPFVSVVVLVLLAVSRAINYQTKILDIYDQLASEIEALIGNLKDSQEVLFKKEQLKALLQNKKKGSKDENLKLLIALQQEIRAALETKP